MTENKLITNIIFDNLNQGIKNIGEKCLNFQEQNKNLKEQLTRKTQECKELKNNFSIEHAKLLNARSKIEGLKKQIESDKGLITNAGKQNYQLVQEYDRPKVENEHQMLQIIDEVE